MEVSNSKEKQKEHVNPTACNNQVEKKSELFKSYKDSVLGQNVVTQDEGEDDKEDEDAAAIEGNA